MEKKKHQSISELKASVLELDREIFAIRSELSMNRKLEKPHLLKAKRREKARVLTQLTLKQKSQAAGKEA
ncbi:MAG: 50S ribosomal protein L29 [Chlamydiia bacterium]|nr:50S ribosomal protein L29 [Chlamydiia bacterium]